MPRVRIVKIFWPETFYFIFRIELERFGKSPIMKKKTTANNANTALQIVNQ